MSGGGRLPPGVDWIPVDTALARLRDRIEPVAGAETVPVAAAAGRVLAAAVTARRANPPAANAAVDGYGFAHAALPPAPVVLPLIEARAAAGQPLAGVVPPGMAVRILTGAILPHGVDTVAMQEHCELSGGAVAVAAPPPCGANTRPAGEDVASGAMVLAAGHRLGPPDLALLAAVGVGTVTVRRALRVAVLSTGDELVPDPSAPAAIHQIYDANRPMLLALIRAWGFDAVDLGHAPDDPARITAAFAEGAGTADAILTTGGASTGDEDHVARLLAAHGAVSSWRIAMKPGRPLVLAGWDGVPVLGLPGNPVAALVCALVFGWPALRQRAGAGWPAPQGFQVAAAFAKRKAAGRREYLRARLTPEGAAEVFPSEGSGLVSGLSWATGIVELPDAACAIAPGDPVRYVPFASFGLPP